ncbi:MAG TPA: hypothetical protein GYA10_16850, partial [Alphaproteobacteria bacterium]|nr:hypothetical protein [Alphaproteobacteria bacterium]
MVLALIVLGAVAFGVLAMRRAPLWQWAAAVLVLGALTRFGFDATGFGVHVDLPGWIGALLPGAILLLLTIPQVRRALV